MTTVRIRDGHDNNWTVLRILMAMAVLVGHAMIVGARDLSAEPMVYSSYSISYMAVNAFFVASGFLVTASMMHRKSLVEFASARALRIYPALAVHVLVVMLVVGAANTTLPVLAYLAHPEVWLQLPKILTFANTDFILPEVFADNHEPYASAPLWTLRYEVLAYIGTGLLFALGCLRAKWMVALPFVVAAVAHVGLTASGLMGELPATLKLVMRFALPYGLGALIWACRDDLPFRLWALPVVALAAWVAKDSALAEVSMNLAVGYVLFFLAYSLPSLAKWTRSDISYGVYIWHWPILQWMAAKNPEWGITPLMVGALVLTPIAAYASWRWVEKPMLARKGKLSAALRGRRLATA